MNNFNKTYKNLLESTKDEIVVALRIDSYPKSVPSARNPIKNQIYMTVREEPVDTWLDSDKIYSKKQYDDVVKTFYRFVQANESKRSLVYIGDDITSAELLEKFKSRIYKYKDSVEYWDIHMEDDYSYFDAVGRVSNLFKVKQATDKDEEDISNW